MTHELNTSSMQACYVNTTRPDFIGGLKVHSHLPVSIIFSTALVTERQNSNKSHTASDPKNPKAQINNNKDLNVDAKKASLVYFLPKSIQPQNALSKRGTMETEVISCVALIYTDFTHLEYLTPQCFFKQICLLIHTLRLSNGRLI